MHFSFAVCANLVCLSVKIDRIMTCGAGCYNQSDNFCFCFYFHLIYLPLYIILHIISNLFFIKFVPIIIHFHSKSKKKMLSHITHCITREYGDKPSIKIKIFSYFLSYFHWWDAFVRRSIIALPNPFSSTLSTKITSISSLSKSLSI